VRGILHGYPDVNNASITMSRDTLRLLGLNTKDGKTGPLMVRIKDPSRSAIVRDQLNAVSKGAYKAWTREDLAKANESAIMGEQIIGIFLTFSVFLGFLIGVGITSQTLRGAIWPRSRNSRPCAPSAFPWARCAGSCWSCRSGSASSA
jgi:putative ABC transport system permease protein